MLKIKPNFSLTGKCFPLTNFSNSKQIQKSLESGFPKTTSKKQTHPKAKLRACVNLCNYRNEWVKWVCMWVDQCTCKKYNMQCDLINKAKLREFLDHLGMLFASFCSIMLFFFNLPIIITFFYDFLEVY